MKKLDKVDPVMEWLEKNMNKNGYFYYKQSDKSEGIIDCFWKKDDKHFAYFYRKEIEKMLYGGRTDKESEYGTTN